MLGLCLHGDLKRATEAIEVVHVQRTEVGLHGLEHVRDRHASRFGLGAIQIREQLRHVHLIAGEEAGKLRRLIAG